MSAMKASVVTNRLPVGGAHRDAGEKILIARELLTGLTGAAGGVLLMARPDGSLLRMSRLPCQRSRAQAPLPPSLSPVYCWPASSAAHGGRRDVALPIPAVLKAAIVAGAALVTFEVVECIVIGFMPLQAIEGAVGVAVVGLRHSGWWRVSGCSTITSGTLIDGRTRPSTTCRTHYSRHESGCRLAP